MISFSTGSNREAFRVDHIFYSTEDAQALQFMGVYVVYADDEIIYIGKTIDIATRWRSHERFSDFVDLGMTEVRVIRVDSRTELAETERILIKRFMPALNRVKFKSSPQFSSARPAVQPETQEVKAPSLAPLRSIDFDLLLELNYF